ncbi:hypothetical protein SDC9_154662 [bioreactor metagenome]|uniref:Uncharacterized protein n=1 Tax=bioreactor metagenome TaxID=1076179 RepID=A0A645F1K4_9ZZZZ
MRVNAIAHKRLFVMLCKYITRNSGEKPIIIFFLPETFHNIFRRTVEPVVFSIFVGDKTMDNRNNAVALFCDHGQLSVLYFGFRGIRKLRNFNRSKIFLSLPV